MIGTLALKLGPREGEGERRSHCRDMWVIELDSVNETLNGMLGRGQSGRTGVSVSGNEGLLASRTHSITTLQTEIAEYTMYFSAASASLKSSARSSRATLGYLCLCMNWSNSFNVVADSSRSTGSEHEASE